MILGLRSSFFVFKTLTAMKKLIILSAVSVLLFSCSPKAQDPVQTAIESEILSLEQNFSQVSISSLELVDSTTYRQELEHRRGIFETKRKSDEQFLMKYMNEGKRKNANIKNESYVRDLLILKALDSLELTISSILDNVAYYDYKFTAVAKGESGTMQFNGSYAALSPDSEVLCISSSQKDLHRGLGKVLPGYLEIVKNQEEDPEN